jgi:predicted phosphodiesterase
VSVAALYDIHGNLPALEAVLREDDVRRADVVVVGGDAVSGPMPLETLTLLESLPQRVEFVRGNADRVLDFPAGLTDEDDVWVRSRRWVADRLGDSCLDRLRAFPVEVTLDVEGVGGVRFCHGAPGSDGEVVTRATPARRLRRLLEGVQEGVVVCGHTHIQFDRSVGGTRVLNAGSIGAPYESRPGAYWLLLEPEITFRRTAYDVAEAAERILATGYPNAGWFAAQIALDDVSQPERMTAAIEQGV